MTFEREQVRTIDHGTGLTVIVSPAVAPVQAGSTLSQHSDAPTILYLNSGAGQLSGHSRLHTNLARQLSKAGFPGLRIPGGHEQMTLSSSTVTDIMDYMQNEFHAEHFTIHASGPEAGFLLELARKDTRITGLFLIDVAGFRTRKFYLDHYGIYAVRKLFKRTRLKASSLLKGKSESASTPTGLPEQLQLPESDRHELRYSLWDLFRKGTRMHFLFTGGSGHYYNYANQFEDMCEGLADTSTLPEQVSFSHYPLADHRLMFSNQRDQVCNKFLVWMQSGLPMTKRAYDREAA